MENSKCRFCQTKLEYTFIDLGMQPLCEEFVKAEGLKKMEAFYPLHAYVCHTCFLVQVEDLVPPEKIYEDYPYFSSYSTSWLKHAKDYTDYISERLDLNSSSFVSEIASNDGYLLQYFKEKNFNILGIEPSGTVAEFAINEKQIPTEIKFFGVETAKYLKEKYGQPDLLLGNNVLAHVPDVNDFVEGMKIFLKGSGAITMEFPHLQTLIEKNEFDTIYQEHFSYLSFTSVSKIFEAHGLELFDVQELKTHGGSLRIFAKHKENKDIEISKNVANLLNREKKLGFQEISYYSQFEEKIKKLKRNLLRTLSDIKDEGKTIVGYGAPGKGNTLLNYCGIKTDFLDYTVDRNPVKHGMYTPGSIIPILHPDEIKKTKPDYIFILPWNLKDEIMAQLSYVKEWGAKFIIPVPEVEIIESVNAEVFADS